MPRSNMRATRLAPLFVLLPLLVVRSASGESLPASTWPEKLSKEDVACLELLRPAARLAQSVADLPAALDRIRAAWRACQGPAVDARFFARSARLRLIEDLDRYEPKLALMQEARVRLERLGEPSPELFRVLEELGSLACQNKDLEASISLYEDALKLREQLFGEKSLESSEGMIHLAHIYASGCESGSANHQRARMYAELAVDNFIGCGQPCRPAYLCIVMQYAGVLEAMGLVEGGQEISTLFLREWGDSPAVQALIRRPWLDEPLPEAPAQD